MNRPIKTKSVWACITTCAILALLFASLFSTAVVKVKPPSADACEETHAHPPAALTAVVKVKHLSAVGREETHAHPPAALTAVVKTKHLLVDACEKTHAHIPAALTAVVKTKHLSVDACEETHAHPPAALTAVVKVKHLSVDTTASDTEGSTAIGMAESFDEELGGLWERFLEILPTELSDLAGRLDEFGGEKITELLFGNLAPMRAELARAAAIFVAMTVLYAACELLPERHKSISDAVGAALSSLLAIPALAIVIGFIGDSLAGLRSSSEFFSELVPIMTTVSAIGIGGSTAALTASVSSVVLGLCEGVVLSGVYPLFALVFMLSVLEGLDTGRTVSSFSAGARKLISLLCGTAPIAIGGVLSLGTLITASRDTLALRGAKYALSGMVPVVGNVISGSIGALISGCKLLSGVLGPLAVCTLLYYLAAPLLSLLLLRLLISMISGAAEMLGAARGARLMCNLRGALDAIIAPIGASALIYVFEIVIFISAVSGVSV